MPAYKYGGPLCLPPLAGQSISLRQKGLRLFQAFKNTNNLAALVDHAVNGALLAEHLDSHFIDGHFLLSGVCCDG